MCCIPEWIQLYIVYVKIGYNAVHTNIFIYGYLDLRIVLNKLLTNCGQAFRFSGPLFCVH